MGMLEETATGGGGGLCQSVNRVDVTSCIAWQDLVVGTPPPSVSVFYPPPDPDPTPIPPPSKRTFASSRFDEWSVARAFLCHACHYPSSCHLSSDPEPVSTRTPVLRYRDTDINYSSARHHHRPIDNNVDRQTRNVSCLPE